MRIQSRIEIMRETNEISFHSGTQSKCIKVEPIMSSILAKISDSKGLVSREELIESIWDGNADVGDKSLTRNIYKIRKIFEQNSLKNPIETIPKKGYRFKNHTTGNSKSKNHIRKFARTALAIVLVIVILKVAYPGIGHFISHRLLH